MGIALASDVLASTVSAYIYKKNNNLDVRNGLIILATVMVFTAVGSFVAHLVPSKVAGNFSIVATAIIGLKFLVRPILTTKEKLKSTSKTKQTVQSIILGSVVGFVCGFIGAGGGMMMLFVFTSILGYELKTAIGTSVFVMTFTALTGAISHFTFGGSPDWLILVLCMLFTFIWARTGARIANKVSAKVLNRTMGVLLLALGLVIIIINLIYNL